MMAYSQDAVVTSSQEDCGDISILSSALILEQCQKNRGKNGVNPHLKMVAKVFPWSVRGKDKPEAEADDDVIFDKVISKKQAFPWIPRFNALCKEASAKQSYYQLDRLMDIFIKNVTLDVKNCYKKPNRAGKLKTKMSTYLKIFYSLYEDVRRPIEHDNYLDKMSHLLTMYIDMEIKASRRNRDSSRTISCRLTSSLFILLRNSTKHILDAILKAKFFVKKYAEICVPVITGVVRDISRELDEVTYIQYILVFKKWKLMVRKEERVAINRLASMRLTPPPGFVDRYSNQEKYNNWLQHMPPSIGNSFTLMLMQDPELNVKDTSKGCTSQLDTSKSNCDTNEKRFKELGEDHFIRYCDNTQESERRSAIAAQKLWDEIDSLTHDDQEQNVFDVLYENEFAYCLKRVEKEQERKIHEATAKLANKEKKNQLDKSDSVELDLKSIHDSLPKISADIFGLSPTKSTSITTQTEPSVKAQTDVPKMEADSQSQDETSPLDFVLQKIKIEPEDQVDEEESIQRDSTSVLRAVVRPENVELSSHCDSNMNRLTSHENQIEKAEGFAGFDSESASIANEGNPEVLTVEPSRTEREVAVASTEESEQGVKPPCTDSSGEAGPPSNAVVSNELLLDEFSNYSTPQGVPFGIDAEGPNPFSDIFDSTNDFFCFETGIIDGSMNDAMSMSFSHDFFLGQYGDGTFTLNEDGTMNHSLDLYNDQQDIVFEGDMVTLPMMDEMKDDPVEYLATTHWDDLNMMESEPTLTSPERLNPPETQDGPIVVFHPRPRPKKSKRNAKSKKEKIPPKHVKNIFLDTEVLTERKCKYKSPAAESARPAPPQRKRSRKSEEEKVVEGKQAGNEPEPKPKKQKGRQKKQSETEMPPPAPPSPPPQTNSKKTPKASGSQTKNVTRKKPQNRRKK